MQQATQTCNNCPSTSPPPLCPHTAKNLRTFSMPCKFQQQLLSAAIKCDKMELSLHFGLGRCKVCYEKCGTRVAAQRGNTHTQAHTHPLPHTPLSVLFSFVVDNLMYDQPRGEYATSCLCAPQRFDSAACQMLLPHFFTAPSSPGSGPFCRLYIERRLHGPLLMGLLCPLTDSHSTLSLSPSLSPKSCG